MFERLKKLYGDNKLSQEQLEHAVELKWITEEQKAQIISSNTL